jgi:hypothetical protein
MEFMTQTLLTGGYLVTGVDSTGNEGTAVLRSPAWDRVLQFRSYQSKSEAYEQAVEEFFAPLLEAVAQVEGDAPKDWKSITLDPGVQGIKSVTVDLDEAGIVLRLVEEDPSCLRWVEGALVAVAP